MVVRCPRPEPVPDYRPQVVAVERTDPGVAGEDAVWWRPLTVDPRAAPLLAALSEALERVRAGHEFAWYDGWSIVPLHDRVLDDVGPTREHPVALWPRWPRRGAPTGALRPDANDALGLGRFHPGLLMARPGAEPFLEYLASELALADEPAGRVLDLAAATFGADELRGDVLTAWRPLPDGAPDDIVIVDLEGYDPERPWLIDGRFADRPRVRLSERPALREVLDAAAARRRARPEDLALPGDLRVDSGVRSLVRDAVRRWQAGTGELPPDPFSPGGHRAFLDWLNATDRASFGTASRYFWSLYCTRPDLQAAFRLPSATGAQAFADWSSEVWLPEGRSLLLAPSTVRIPVPAPVAEPRPGGVNVIGYLDADFSLGHIARQLRTTIEATGRATAGLTYSRTESPRLAVPPVDDPTLPYATTVAVVNADQFDFLAGDLGPAAFASRHTIGYWFWELEVIPPPMRRAIAHIDEIWAGSDFIRDAFRAVTVKPVHTLRPVLDLPSPSARRRDSFGLADDCFVFLCTFDFFSVVERKNPFGVVDAFRRAFAGRDDVRLVVKSTNGHLRSAAFERLLLQVAGADNIVVMDEHLTRADQMALIAASDAVVSLHRSEGLGLHLAEAMALGTPVVATRYSGNLDFMDDTNSWLVDAAMVPVQFGEGVYPKTARWADPDLDQAADMMRAMVDDRSASTAKVSAALQTAMGLAGDAASERVRARLDELPG